MPVHLLRHFLRCLLVEIHVAHRGLHALVTEYAREERQLDACGNHARGEGVAEIVNREVVETGSRLRSVKRRVDVAVE